MKTIKPNLKAALQAKLSGVLALLIVFAVAVACSFNTGADTVSKDKKSDSDKTTRKSALSDDDVAGMKKATGTKSSKKSGATSENADEGDFIPVYSEIENERFAGNAFLILGLSDFIVFLLVNISRISFLWKNLLPAFPFVLRRLRRKKLFYVWLFCLFCLHFRR